METKTEKGKEQQQWENPISQSSSSRSSSITSDSSDGHFVLRHFPLPKPAISASEAQKQREIYNSGQLHELPGYDPNRIPFSVFSKPANSAEWSIASNESLFSIHDGNFGFGPKEDYGMRLSEIPRFEEPIHEITEIKPVPLPLPPVKKQDQEEKSDSEIDDNEEEEELLEIESEEEEDMIEPVESVEIDKPEEDVKEATKPEDLNSTASHSPSFSCRSDTSNNSTRSFAFPVLKKEIGITKTPCLEVKGNISHKRRPEFQLPQPLMQPPQPQPPQPASSESSTLPLPQPQQKTSKTTGTQTQSPKVTRISGWFSCFHWPKRCGIFK